MIVAVPYRLSLSLLVVVSTLSLTVPPAWPHGGGLDKYGCHHNRVQGGYHCHRGVFKGRDVRQQGGDGAAAREEQERLESSPGTLARELGASETWGRLWNAVAIAVWRSA